MDNLRLIRGPEKHYLFIAASFILILPCSNVPFLESGFFVFLFGTFWNGANSTIEGYSFPAKSLASHNILYINTCIAYNSIREFSCWNTSINYDPIKSSIYKKKIKYSCITIKFLYLYWHTKKRNNSINFKG